MNIISIDVGYTNLAIVRAKVSVEDEYMHIEDAHLINLKRVKCGDRNCVFARGDTNATHKIIHCMSKFDFSDIDKVLIERQPPGWGCGIEQAICMYLTCTYPHKKEFVHLISPNACHAHFSMSSEKAHRRTQVVEMMQEHATHLDAWIQAKEKDHIADACMFVRFFVETYSVVPKKNMFARLIYSGA